jgi:IgA-specific serine endopeptidase
LLELMPADYEALKALVKSHDKQAAEVARVRAEAQAQLASLRADAERARAAANRAEAEAEQLRAAARISQARKQSEKREALNADAERKRELKSAADTAMASERERFHTEVALIREAAQADVWAVQQTSEGALAAAAAQRKDELDELRQQMTCRSHRHAARLREVIASEEAASLECQSMRRKSTFAAVQRMALAVRVIRAEKCCEVQMLERRLLASELRSLEHQLNEAREMQQSQQAAALLGAAAAEAQVHELRHQIHGVARKQKAWREALVQQAEQELERRVREEVARARRESHERMERELQAQTSIHESAAAAHRQEVTFLQAELKATRQQLADLTDLLKSQHSELGIFCEVG